MYNVAFKLDNSVLTIHVSGRIDSDNAQALSNDIDKIIDENRDFSSVVMDFDGLEAISSAGLRVMLKLKKKYDDFCIINACNVVYDVFEITGFSTIINIKKAFRKLSVDGCQVIGEGAKGIVYRYNSDIIIKVYKSANSLEEISENMELARNAFLRGIPTAISYDIVKVGDLYGSVYELVDSKSLSELISANPDKISEYVDDFVNLLNELENVPIEADWFPDIKFLIRGWWERVRKYLTEEENAKIVRLIDETPDDLKAIHGDYHTNNIVYQGDTPLLLDLDTLAHGNPVFELANIFFTYVGFNEIYPEGNATFLGLDAEVCSKFYDLFISEFLKGRDNIEDLKNRISFAGYLRCANHLLKRENDSAKVEKCLKLLRESLSKIDALGI